MPVQSTRPRLLFHAAPNGDDVALRPFDAGIRFGALPPLAVDAGPRRDAAQASDAPVRFNSVNSPRAKRRGAPSPLPSRT
jgi:hypothetical protein